MPMRDWDATGMYLISYAMPRKAIRLTGSRPSVVAPLDAKSARQARRGRARGHRPRTIHRHTTICRRKRSSSTWPAGLRWSATGLLR